MTLAVILWVWWGLASSKFTIIIFCGLAVISVVADLSSKFTIIIFCGLVVILW